MKGLTPKEIKAELDNIHSTSAPAFATVYNWMNEFKRGRTSTCDAPRSGHPIGTVVSEIIDKVHNIVLTDRRVKVREVVEATDISHGTVISILHEQLGMKKLSARWMPRLLTVEHKRDVTISKQCLKMFQRNPDEFLRRFITVDMDPLHLRRNSQNSESAPKKTTLKSAGKVMATIFWDARGIIIDYYAALLDCFNNILKKKRSHLAKKKVLFHQDNTRVHTCPAPITKFNEFRYELLPHLAYSPDLALCDYFLFPNLKKWFGEKRFTTREQFIAEIEAYFEGLDKSYYSDGLKKLENRWIKCIELKGDYVEK
ncbi:SETMR methyltransferase, partial [Acromyrmex insinuator]